MKLPMPVPPAGLTGHVLRVGREEYVMLAWPAKSGGMLQDLSPAESEVVQLAASGLSNSQIANARRKSLRTIANQLASAFRKLGIRSRLELFAIFSGAPRRSP